MSLNTQLKIPNYGSLKKSVGREDLARSMSSGQQQHEDETLYPVTGISYITLDCNQLKSHHTHVSKIQGSPLSCQRDVEVTNLVEFHVDEGTHEADEKETPNTAICSG